MKYQKIVKAISTKGLTKALINKFSILNGAKYFSLGILLNYLVFTEAKNYIKYLSGTVRTESWKSDRMSVEGIENITKSDSNFAQTFVDHYLLPDTNFNKHCLIKNDIPIPKKIICLFLSLINLDISYTLDPHLRT